MGQEDESGSGTVVDIRISGSTVQSISIQGSAILDISHNFQKTGLSYAEMSSGMIGILNLTLPMLKASCTVEVLPFIGDDTIFIEKLEPLK